MSGMVSEATLRLIIDTGDAPPAVDDLSKLSEAAHKAEGSFTDLQSEAGNLKKELADLLPANSAADMQKISDASTKTETALSDLKEQAKELKNELANTSAGQSLDSGFLFDNVEKSQQDLDKLLEKVEAFKDKLAESGASGEGLSLQNIELAIDKVASRFDAVSERAKQMRDQVTEADQQASLDNVIQSAENAKSSLENLSSELNNAKDKYNELSESVSGARQQLEQTNQGAEQQTGLMTRLGGAVAGVVAQLLKWGSIAFSAASTYALFKAVEAADEAEKSVAKLRQGIESTGGAAQRTLSQITDLTQELSFNSIFSDEELNNAASRLLTFNRIVGDRFDETLELSADFASRFGQSVESAALQIGRALQNPSQGTGLLSRTAGIRLDKSEQDKIDALISQNKLYEAQEILIKKIRTAVGGSAAAIADAGDQSKRVYKQLGEVLEALGVEQVKATSEAYRELAKELSNPETINSAKLIGQAIGEGMAAAITAVKEFLVWFRELKSEGVAKDVFGQIPIRQDIARSLSPSPGGGRTRARPYDPFSQQDYINIASTLNNKQITALEFRREALREGIVSADRSGSQDKSYARDFAEFSNINKVLELTKSLGAYNETLDETSAKTGEVKDATAGLLDTFDTQLGRQVAGMQAVLNAALSGGEEAAARAQEQVQIEDRLYQLRQQAGNAGQAFDEAAARAQLSYIAGLKESIALANQLYELRIQMKQQATQPIVQRVIDRVEGFRSEVARQQQRGNLTKGGTVDNLTRQQFELEQFLDKFLESSEAVQLGPEQIDYILQAFKDAGVEFKGAVKNAADDLAESIDQFASVFVNDFLSALAFEGPKGVGQLISNELRNTAKSVLIDPLSDWLTGDLTGTLGEAISGQIEESSKKFGKITSGLDKVLGANGSISKLFGEGGPFDLGAGFASFAAGGAAGDVFTGKSGETGKAIGGAAGFLLAGPIGGAIGGFLGDIFGSLFGRKSAKGSIDLDTGESFGVADSKKGSRNDRRDEILSSSFDKLQRLADLLGASLRVGSSVQVTAGKKSITTDIIDTETGQVLSSSKVGKDEIRQAIDNVLDNALSAIIEGGDERLRRIADSLLGKGLPVDKVIGSLEKVASYLELTKEPTSDFIEVIDDLNKTFKESIDLAQRYEQATRDIQEAQREVLVALGGKFDEGLDKKQREIENPLAQQAFDLAEAQALLIKEAQKLNESLSAVGESAGTQERLERVLKINRDEWTKFIEEASDTPAALKSVTEALKALQAQSKIPLSSSGLDAQLELVRQSLADAFDESIADRNTQLTNPAQAKFDEIIREQLKLIEAAKAVSKDDTDFQRRLDQLAVGNTEEIRQFLESSSNTAQLLEAAAKALETSAIKLEEQGVDTTLLRRQITTARSTLAESADERTVERILSIVSNPTLQLRQLVQRQSKDLDVTRASGGDVALAQRANYLEIADFLDQLSDTDLSSIGDFFGIITDELGRLPVVMLELDKVFKQFIDDREQETERLRDLQSRGAGLNEQTSELDQYIRRNYGGLLDTELVDTIRNQLYDQLAIARDPTKEGEQRLTAVERGTELSRELIDQIAQTYGGLNVGAQERDNLLAIIKEFGDISKKIGEDAGTQADQIEALNKTMIEVRDKIQSPDPKTTENIADILATGKINNELVSGLLGEFVNLSRASQQQMEALKTGVREAAIAGFSGNVSVVGTVAIDDKALNSTLTSIREVLLRIENNQRRGATESRLGITSASG